MTNSKEVNSRANQVGHENPLDAGHLRLVSKAMNKKDANIFRALKILNASQPRGWQKQVAIDLNVDPSFVSQWVSGAKRVPAETREKLAAALGFSSIGELEAFVTLVELDLGDNECRLDAIALQKAREIAADVYHASERDRILGSPNSYAAVYNGARTEQQFKTVSFLESKVSAGGGSLEVSATVKGHLSFRSDWLSPKGNPEKMLLMTVTGDSMSPLILDDDVVLIDTAQKEISQGRIYVVAVGEELKIKRVYTGAKAQSLYGHNIANSTDVFKDVVLISEMADQYPPQFIPEGQFFDVIGRVIWLGRETKLL